PASSHGPGADELAELAAGRGDGPDRRRRGRALVRHERLPQRHLPHLPRLGRAPAGRQPGLWASSAGPAKGSPMRSNTSGLSQADRRTGGGSPASAWGKEPDSKGRKARRNTPAPAPGSAGTGRRHDSPPWQGARPENRKGQRLTKSRSPE